MPRTTTATTTPARSGPATSASARLAELFPDESSQPRRRWWRRGRIVLGVAVALLVTALVATEAFGSSTPNYVTATVSRQNVASTLTGVATIEPTAQASVAFPVSGTVATIDVEVNDTVSAGQVLATLDPTSLNTTLHQKELTLAQAQLTLSKALAGESVSGAGGSSPSASTSGGQTTGSPTAQTTAFTSSSADTYVLAAATSGPGPGPDPALAAAQQAVLAAQKHVDAALAEANAAMASATEVCAGITSTSPSTTTATTQPDPVAACANALTQVQEAQKAVSTAQNNLATASAALDALLAQQSTPSTTTPAGASGSGGSGAPSTSGTPSTGGAGGSGSTSTATSSNTKSASPSSQDLIAYQKAVDADQAAVTEAQQAVAQATIVSPISGKVVAVDMSVGDTVTSASTTSTIIVKGTGGYEVTTDVSVDKITDVAVGQSAVVLPDGSSQKLAGKVVSISAQPDSSSSSTAYRVVVGLDNPTAKLDNGSTGTVEIVTGVAKMALAVPTSAVTTSGTRHTVQVVSDGATRRVSVEVGVTGDRWIEITGGLSEGQHVVLANPAEPLPGSATSSSNSSKASVPSFGGAGGFPTLGRGTR